MQKELVLQKYKEAIKAEGLNIAISAEELYDLIMQLTQFAALSLVPRTYSHRYLLATKQRTYESVAGHTLLVQEMMSKALNFFYRPNFYRTKDGFTRYEILEAVNRHDLPENEIGDVPDNGDRQNEALAPKEDKYLENFSKYSPSREVSSETKISFLLKDQNSQFKTTTGSQIHVADKAAGVFMNLCLEEKGLPPIMHPGSLIASEGERDQMKRCERHLTLDGIQFCYASEMWTMSFFDRGIAKLDHGHFFTGLIIMKTIEIAGQWYTWREQNHA